MPRISEVLLQTMMFTGARPIPPPLPPNAPIGAPEPKPQVSTDHAIRLKNPVWSWTHDPARPARITDLKSKVLGMGMMYAHSMLVCKEISMDEVTITTKSDKEFFLPLDTSFVMQKAKIDSGHIPASGAGLWRLEAELDQSILVLFAYQIVDGAIKPFTAEQANRLGSDAMPEQGKESQPDPVAVGQEKNVVLSPLRILVCFSITCCKERDDFEPGGVLGANRVYPHVMVMASAQLKRVSAVITVARPANSTPSHGDAEMNKAISPILVTDSNLPRGNILGPPLPQWDNLFDYYEMDPIGQFVKTVTLVDGDPKSKRASERRQSRLLMKEKSIGPAIPANFYEPVDLRKLPRQGEFDSLHLAPTMKVPPLGQNADPQRRASLRLDNIAMAPFCVHDCLHTHVRWGVEAADFLTKLFGGGQPASVKGFDKNFNPNSVDGSPLVPHNQTVHMTLLSGSSILYEAIVHEPVEPGRWHVFFHHGMGYANEIWEPGTVNTARTTVEVSAFKGGEHDFNRRSPPGTPSLNAGSSFAVFYWRLRFGGAQDTPMERLGILAPEACRKL